MLSGRILEGSEWRRLGFCFLLVLWDLWVVSEDNWMEMSTSRKLPEKVASAFGVLSSELLVLASCG